MTNIVYFRVAVAAPLFRLFDYLPPPHHHTPIPKPGVRVRVPFGNKTVIGILAATHQERPAFALKPVEAVLDSEPLLDDSLIQLLTWAADYYCYPVGEVFSAALPTNLRKGKTAERSKNKRWLAKPSPNTEALLNRAPKQLEVYRYLAENPEDGRSETEISALFHHWRPVIRALSEKGLAEQIVVRPKEFVPGRKPDYCLNTDQQAAIDQIVNAAGRYQSFLLHGITGSGKTEVYLQVTEKILAQGKQILILVPEIGLTPQLISSFQSRFQTSIAVLHSRLNHRERMDAWLSAQQGEGRIIIGTRSAIFVPLISPGLIIVDEEHDSSFKQMDGFRYSARDLAIKRASLLNIPVLLGSATPSLESFANTFENKSIRLSLPERVGDASIPDVCRIDMRNKRLNHGLAQSTIQAIQEEMDIGGQALIFLNRRGFAPSLLCTDCGWISHCHHCDIRMTVHRAAGRIRCHVCSFETRLPAVCPDCGRPELIYLGQGTERMEDFLSERFPDSGVIRIDRDSTRRKGAFDRIIRAIRSGEKRILIGTQMLAKGHHFPQLGTVVIMDADSGLYGIDFRSQERMAQLITQVSGRAGRSGRPGKVYIQTYHPQHPVFEALEKKPYEILAAEMLKERQATGMPPYHYLALLRVEANQMDKVEKFIHQAANHAESLQRDGMQLLGPAVAPLERKAGRYHMQLLIKSSKRSVLQTFLGQWVKALDAMKDARKVRWSIDVDPYDLY